MTFLAATAMTCFFDTADAKTKPPATKAAVTAPKQVDPGWNLADLYPSPEAWTAAYTKLKADADALESFKGTLGKSAPKMFAALSEMSRVRKEANRLYTYASLKADEDVRVAPNQERQQLAGTLMTTIGEKTSWLAPEVLSIGAEKVAKFQDKSPELKSRFGFFLNDIIRGAPHTLSAEAESVLAATGNVLAQPNNVYSTFANGELPFPTITLASGETVQLTQANYSKYRQSANREDRKKVFDAFWPAWKTYEGTFGAMMTTQVMGDTFSARARKFDTSLQAAVFGENMPESVYRTLVAQANKNLPTLHRYLKLRKELLGVKDDLQYFDVYPPIFKSTTPLKFTVDDSKAITLEIAKPYGDEYEAALKQGFAGSWMNSYPSPGKHNGAYMNGSAYDVHPYVLLNHNDDFDSLSTFAHEWGHAVHTLLASKAQPYELSNYSTFTAETASIANEMLLSDYMVAKAKTNAEKLYYLGEELEMMRGTFFRQTLFAEFQLRMHEEIEKGGSLSGERLTQLYCELTKKYYGDAEGVMKIDPKYCIEWAFIPHFYYGYYVYQYATSIVGAAAFTDAIAKEGAPARDRFINMLKAGGSDYPINLYNKAGIDMTADAPYEALIARMNRVMDEIEKLRKAK
ncbi:MAG: oligoendopeptidase F [Caulobacterales bacterium]